MYNNRVYIELNVDDRQMYLNPDAISYIWSNKIGRDVVRASIITNTNLTLKTVILGEDYVHWWRMFLLNIGCLDYSSPPFKFTMNNSEILKET